MRCQGLAYDIVTRKYVGLELNEDAEAYKIARARAFRGVVAVCVTLPLERVPPLLACGLCTRGGEGRQHARRTCVHRMRALTLTPLSEASDDAQCSTKVSRE